MTNYRPHWSHYVVAAHLAVFVVTGYALALTRSDLLRVILTIVSGTSLFVLTGLTHEATHHLLRDQPGSTTCSGTWPER